MEEIVKVFAGIAGFVGGCLGGFLKTGGILGLLVSVNPPRTEEEARIITREAFKYSAVVDGGLTVLTTIGAVKSKDFVEAILTGVAAGMALTTGLDILAYTGLEKKP